jgi:hypothetical protein
VAAHRPLEFFGRRLRRADRQRGEARQPLRVPPNRRRELVVAFAGQPNGLRPVQLFHARRGQRQDRHVDARVVHRRDPAVAQIADRFDDARARRQPATRTAQEFRCGVMLFES